MAKFTLPRFTSSFSITAKLNQIVEALEDLMQNRILYRDNVTGEPNQMKNLLDMDYNHIINLPDAVNDRDAVNLQQLQEAIDDTGFVPRTALEGGAEGQILTKASDDDLEFEWRDHPTIVPATTETPGITLYATPADLLGTPAANKSVTPALMVGELSKLIKPVASIAELRAVPATDSTQFFYVASYHAGLRLGGGLFVYDSSVSSGEDYGYVIVRTSGGVFRRLTGDGTLEDYGYSGGTMTLGHIRGAINSGNIKTLTSNLVLDSYVQNLMMESIPNTKGLKINGAVITDKSVRSRVYASPPTDFPFQVDFKCWIEGDRVETDLDLSQFDTIANGTADVIYYIDPVAGVIGNSGLTEVDPMKDFYSVLMAEQSAPPGRKVGILAKGGFYPRTRSWTDSPVKPNYDLTVKSWDGKLVEMWEAEASPSFTSIGDNAYTTTRSATFIVVDRSLKNSFGDYLVYKKVDTQAEVKTTPGSFHINTSNNLVTVRCMDDRVPDANILIAIGSGSLIEQEGDRSFNLYCENIGFFGGSSGGSFINKVDTNSINVVLNRCIARYCYVNGFSFQGIDYAISVDCEASYVNSDGFNYHSHQPGVSGIPLYSVEINCLAHHCGSPILSDASNRNASTSHDSCHVMRFGTVGHTTYGPVIIDVNDAKTYNFFVRSGKSRGISDNADFVISSVNNDQGGAAAWYDNCVTLGGSMYGLMTGAGAIAHVRNCDFTLNFSGVSNIVEFTQPNNFG